MKKKKPAFHLPISSFLILFFLSLCQRIPLTKSKRIRYYCVHNKNIVQVKQCVNVRMSIRFRRYIRRRCNIIRGTMFELTLFFHVILELLWTPSYSIYVYLYICISKCHNNRNSYTITLPHSQSLLLVFFLFQVCLCVQYHLTAILMQFKPSKENRCIHIIRIYNNTNRVFVVLSTAFFVAIQNTCQWNLKGFPCKPNKK